MSEPAKKPGRPPESYSPKAKPEIMKLAQGIHANKTYEVKSQNGGSYIDGVPWLRWGEWKDCTYGGCLALIFDVIGVKASYEQLMGLSGACYKAILGDDWDPSSEMPQVGVNCEHNAPKALGVKAYSLKNEKKRDANVIKSLDKGFPVLLCGQRAAPEWTVLTGYEKTNGGVMFFGRTYFDYEGAPADETYTDNAYYLANQYPGEYPNGLLRFYDKKRKPLTPRKALMISLETCIKTFEPAHGGYKQGYDAYDVYIAGFELGDEEYRAKCGNDQYHVGSLMDARRAAHIYLRESAALLEGENRQKLLQAAALYRAMLDNMLAAVPYEKTSSVFNGSASPMWSARQRQALAKALRINKALEKEVRVIVKDILEHWDAPPESYSPKEKPGIIKMAEGEHVKMRERDAFQAAPPPGGGGVIPVIHRLITSMHGENYWFNGCAAYVMEGLGEPDYDYWFFAGLTGDNFAQVYAHDHFRGDGATDYQLSDGDHASILDVFNRCGYGAEFIPETQLRANPQPYLQKLVESIDRGVPVIRYWCSWHVCVGYEDGGQTLLCVTGDNEEPYRVTARELFEGGQEHEGVFHWFGWIFVGGKKEQKDLRQLYRDAIVNLPRLLTSKTDGYCFGASAFRALADALESDRFEGGKPEGFNAWDVYTVYTCNLATNSGGCQGFLQKAMELNPDFTFLAEVGRQYRLINFLWNKGEWRKNMLTRRERRAYVRRYGRHNLEGLKLGIHNFSEKAFFNRRKRAKAAAILREMANCMDEVVRIVEKGIQEDQHGNALY